MAYHDSEKLVQAAFAEIAEKRPGELQIARNLEAHFVTKQDKPDYPRLHAILTLLLEQTPRKAAQRLVREQRTMHQSGAANLLVDAVSHGPASWQSDKDYIYGLGFIHAKGRYFVVRGDLHKDGPFDRARRLVKPAYQPIVEEAIYLALSKAKKLMPDFGPRALTYVPVLLLARTPERDFKMNALSLRTFDDIPAAAKVSRTAHQDNTILAARAIKLIAAQLGIVLPDGLVETGRSLRREEREAYARTRPAPAHDFARLKTRMESALPDERMTLRGRLQALVKEKAITQSEAMVYFWLRGSRQGDFRLPADASVHFKNLNASAADIMRMNASVEDALRGQVSDRDFHQARAVRP